MFAVIPFFFVETAIVPTVPEAFAPEDWALTEDLSPPAQFAVSDWSLEEA